jgi:tetratricopeptide (TPR) repeat protein
MLPLGQCRVIRKVTERRDKLLPSDETPMTSSSTSAGLERVRDLTRSACYASALAAAEALAVAAPENRNVLYWIAVNQRCLNRIPEALATLERLEQVHPVFSLLFQERGYCLTVARDSGGAIGAFLRAVTLNPALSASWSMLERLYLMAGDANGAANAAGQVALLQELPPEVVRAGSLFADGDGLAAERLVRAYLAREGACPHVEAVRLLARIVRQGDALDEAERLLERAMALAPGYRAARVDYVRVLIDRQKFSSAREEIEALLILEPDETDYLLLSAAAYAGLGEHDTAIEIYRRLLAARPSSPGLNMALGNSLQAVGRSKEAIECYEAGAATDAGVADAYWNLSNLKTYRFSEEAIERARRVEAARETNPADRCRLCFALGKAFEDRGDYEHSWRYYERGNSLKRKQSRYRSEFPETQTREQTEICTTDFFAARAGFGAMDPDPIFIVGLPRSGSTLVEQILASHSQVEGTHELADLQRIVLDLQGSGPGREAPRYPKTLNEMTREDFLSLGQRYLRETRAYRRGKPFFIDKMPNNFRDIGLIHLILPNARIIDVRREPMACCFSNLKQLFASGQEFTYSIEDIARYYRTYLDLMRHWDRVLPGRVLRVWYEDVVGDIAGSVRRILEFCELPFEPACIDFHLTERSILTASSEQVRQPLFREGLFHWRNYEPWLGPLADALGDARSRYRET